MNASKKIMVIAGGSGGHIFPGLAVAQYLIHSGYTVVWLGSDKNMESEIIPKYGIDIKFIRIYSWRGKKLYKKLIMILVIVFAIYQSLKIIKSWKPDLVLSMGGYVSGPSSLAAWLCRIPIIVHEQNRIIGLTNRCVGIVAKKILQGLPAFINSCTMNVGNPLRKNILSIEEPNKRWKHRTGPIRVLVLGGSQGAHIFNNVIPKVAENLSGNLVIWHQVGKEDFDMVLESYNKIKQYHHIIESFIDNVDRAYAWADILISRSGALTVSEVSCVGLPAIFVPFEYHKDHQQFWNAIPLVQSGAARIVRQAEFTSDYISMVLKSWNRAVLLNMANCARNLSVPNSTQKIAQIITQYLDQHG